jgi:sugar lactone lactonase YvrE
LAGSPFGGEEPDDPRDDWQRPEREDAGRLAGLPFGGEEREDAEHDWKRPEGEDVGRLAGLPFGGETSRRAQGLSSTGASVPYYGDGTGPNPLVVAYLVALSVASVLAAIGIIRGVGSLLSDAPTESAVPQPVLEVSRQVYPTSLVQEMGQPLEDEWTLPASVSTVDDAVYVVDTGNDRVLKLDTSGRVMDTFDDAADGGPALRQPMAIASDGRSLFVANSLAAEVLVLDLSGRVEKILPLQPSAEYEKQPRPIGVAVTSDGGVVVSDADNHRVIRLDEEGRVLWTAGTGTRAGGSDGFNVPGSLALDAADNVYVVDTLNGRVVQLSPEGNFIRQFGRLGNTAGTLSRPKGVAVDAAGRVFVSDGLLVAVQVFAPDGAYLGLIGRRDPTSANSESLFQAPAGLSLVGDSLRVVDRFAGLITLRLSGTHSPS